MANSKSKSGTKGAGARAAVRCREAQQRRDSKGGGRRGGTETGALRVVSRSRPVHISEAGILLGRCKVPGLSGEREVRIPYTPLEGSRYLCAGATGAGKTLTILNPVEAVVRRGSSLIFVDPKGDDTALERLEALAQITGKRLFIWTPYGPSVFNPFGHGTPTEIVDKLLCGETFTEPHYFKQAKWFLDLQIRAMQACGKELSLRSIAFSLDPDKVKEMISKVSRTRENREYWDEVTEEMKSLTEAEEKSLMGTRRRLAGLARGDFGPWIDPRTTGGESFDLLSAARSGDIVYFRLDSDNRPLESAALGGAIVNDINTTLGHLQEDCRNGAVPNPVMVVVDEFGAAATDATRLFVRGRSANVSVLLATQTYHADLEQFEGMRERLEDNLSATIVLRQLSEKSAFEVAALAGKEEYKRETHNDKGGVTEVLDERLRVAVDQIQGLERGAALVSVFGRSTEERAMVTRLYPPGRIQAMYS